MKKISEYTLAEFREVLLAIELVTRSRLILISTLCPRFPGIGSRIKTSE